jgi:hypothetical protein
VCAAPAGSDEYYINLKQKGYVVVHNVISKASAESLLKAVPFVSQNTKRQSRWKVLFQNIAAKETGKRKQEGVGKGRYYCNVFQEMCVYEPVIFKMLKDLNLVGETHELSKNGSIALIHSDGETETNRNQSFHFDYDFEHKCFKREKGDYVSSFPVSVIVALEGHTNLNVFEGSCGSEVDGFKKGIAIPMLSALVFRGDLHHGGGSYTIPNTRLHLYYDIPGVIETTFVEDVKGTRDLCVFWVNE